VTTTPVPDPGGDDAGRSAPTTSETTAELYSQGLRLDTHVAWPSDASPAPPALVLCHGFPGGAPGGKDAGASYPELADRIAREGWIVLTFRFRGCGGSQGDFSLGGWLADLRAAIDHLPTLGAAHGIWLAGFGTGGALCVAAGAVRPDVRGVITLGAPADFDDWANHPRRLLQHARDMQVVRDPTFPRELELWTRELRNIRPVNVAGQLAPRPLMVIHGSEDESVPHIDGRVLSDAHGSAELRLIGGAGHDLRHDPRAVAMLLGWLDRQRHEGSQERADVLD
jgi:putative redox protein